MKKLLYFLITVGIVLIVGWFILDNQLNNGSKKADSSVWTTFIGRDTTVGILPDQYANYFTYTVARTRKNVGFRIKGRFPKSRYFSFNVYSLGDNTTQGSLVDYQIKSDSGLPNPFVAHADSTETDDHYTIHVVPDHFKSDNLDNTLAFDNDTRLLSIVIRLYDYDVDDFGGRELPAVEAFSLEEDNQEEVAFVTERLPRPLNLRSIVRRRSLPKMVERLSVLYETEEIELLDRSTSDGDFLPIPFHAIDTRGFIENNDNRYLLAGITKQDDEVYLFKLKPPTHTSGPENINETEVRYWSFNLGNAASYNFNALKDEDAIIADDGYVYIILADEDDQVIKDIARERKFNFLAWNMPWKEALILFRHMLADPSFDAQIDNVPTIKSGSDNFSELQAHHYMGDYAPSGERMNRTQFIIVYADDEFWEVSK